ncbi:MAG: hypothetical protein MZV64_34395 [Ignavibacteriales bacterium]|nr:hypothetical protein [Ignavibacteriales bacterium]
MRAINPEGKIRMARRDCARLEAVDRFRSGTWSGFASLVTSLSTTKI